MTERVLPSTDELIRLNQAGLSYRQIADRFGVDVPAVQRQMTRAGYKSRRPRRDLAERFWEKVDRNGPPPQAPWAPLTSGCWLWNGTMHDTGYGVFAVERQPRRAHRVAYELVLGPIPEGLQLDHLCRVRRCVNPDHLEAVTPATNGLRSESPAAKAARATHCPKGHPYDDANTRRDIRGDRFCRQCKTDYQRRWAQRYKDEHGHWHSQAT